MNNEFDSLAAKTVGMNAGAKVVGIAVSSDFQSAPDGCKPTDVLENCRSVIVLGIPFSPETLGLSPPGYTELRNAYVTKMTDLAKVVSKGIAKESGHKTKAISATGGKTVDGSFYGAISLKHAAELAGIGVITRNYLLTSPDYGNLLWLSAVLTDIDLMPDKKLSYSFCDNCNKCVEVCPSGALNDPASFNKKECSKYFAMEDRKLLIKCYSCRVVCPHRFGKLI